MPSPIRESLHIPRVLLVAGIVCALASVAGVIHVAARVSPTPQTFEVTNVNDSDVGSLRDAIIKANANPGPDTIVFNIPGSGAKVIFLLAALPEITDPLVIDGTTQPGYTSTPLVELNGAFAPTSNGLVIKAGGSTVRGLAIGRFTDIGIWMRDCDNNVIQANHIGVDTTGNVERKNQRGIVLTNSSHNLIGGTTTAARNVISGNFTGIEINGSSNVIQGNFIGTNVAGSAAVSNRNGVSIPFPSTSSSSNNLIGGTSPGAGNLISGNGSGIVTDGDGTIIQGNWIGTDFTGSIPLPNSTGVSAANALIGGLTQTARNVISGNGVGIQLGGVGTIVQGNLIGLNASGTEPLPNTQGGIGIGNANGNTIGGTQPGAANVIAFNNGPGVKLSQATGNSIRGNSIFSNDGLGIDLIGDWVFGSGVSPNDLKDTDTGGNNVQNFPVITSVVSTNNSTTIQGSLSSTPNTAFQIDFYSNSAVDPSGNGEGAQYFNTTLVNTNPNGDATINVTFPVGLPAGRGITATATDPAGNTSEFSAADPTGLRGSIQFSTNSIKLIEDLGTLNLTVLRTGGSSGTLTVDYTTADGTAIAGQDYTSTSGTLTFNDGETSKTIPIPILDDATTEPDETFTVALRTSNRESLGNPNFLTVTVQDHTITPVLSIDFVSVVEGGPGEKTDAVFVVKLSALTSRPINGNYVTRDSTTPPFLRLNATGGPSCNNPGVDYEGASGTFSFPPGGATTFTIPVKVCGDAILENDEFFLLVLTDVSSGVQGITKSASIVDDDALSLAKEAGPNPGQATEQPAALDAVTGLRGPFRLTSLPEWFAAAGGDRRTRVVLFAKNLRLNPGDPPSSVLVRFESSLVFTIPAEDVRPVPNTDLTQVVVRLPDLSPGLREVVIIYQTQQSNVALIRIIP
ncbi:MAG TPA: Calx-beta domain-containing protein [Pyrinomonadaceae bacterium]|nr:Calx-beta domain-containing protein [Pyrinomonadaceae bacterium]